MAGVLDQPWDDCPKKHFVRLNGWVPAAKVRSKALTNGIPKRNRRPVRMFTFCAAGAVDVFTLHLEGIIATDVNDEFSHVSFCERDEGVHAAIRRSLPGAIPFFGEFEKQVILTQAEQNLANDPKYDPLDPTKSGSGNEEQRAIARRVLAHQELRNSFPYDILNLDFCGYFFKNREPFPGSLFKAIRQVIQWQRDRVIPGRAESLAGFTMLFTTSVGPHDLEDAYVEELHSCIETNIKEFPQLKGVLGERFGSDDPIEIRTNDFASFFTLALPKLLVRLIQEEDWYVDPEEPFQVFSFERPIPESAGSYRMLHLVFQVRRQYPPRGDRGLESSPIAKEAYEAVVKSLFESRALDVDMSLDEAVIKELEDHLSKVQADADLYRSD